MDMKELGSSLTVRLHFNDFLVIVLQESAPTLAIQFIRAVLGGGAGGGDAT